MRAAGFHSGRRPGTPGALLPALLAAAGLCAGAVAAEAAMPVRRTGSFSAEGPRTLIILNPVDLSSGIPDAASGRRLRRAFLRRSHWNALPGDSVAILLREHGLDGDKPCMEFQCAFDAGNAAQTEFALFGTTASLPEVSTFNLGLVHVPSSQVVWSRTGDAPKRGPSGYGGSASAQSGDARLLEAALESAVAELDPAKLDLRKPPAMGSLGVMDAGRSTPHSRAAMHRALAHAYKARGYDLLGPSELSELLSALDMDAGAAPPGARGSPGEDMPGMGDRMGLRYLLWTKVWAQGRGYRMDLALYDVSGRKLMRHWPSRETADFAGLLALEDRFLTVLETGSPLARGRPEALSSRPKTGVKALSLGVAAAAGAAMGYLAYRSKNGADEAYRDFGQARSEQEAVRARGETDDQDSQARLYAILAGVSLSIGVAVWSF